MNIILSCNNAVNINSPSAVRLVAAGGLAALRSNWTIYYFATGRTPEAVADVDVYGRRPAEICRPLSTSIRNIRRAVRAYKDYVALTFLGIIHARANARMVRS